jgi:hypothetical protein
MTTRTRLLLWRSPLGFAGLVLVVACVASPGTTPTQPPASPASPSSPVTVSPAPASPTASASPSVSPSASPAPTGSPAPCTLPLPGPLASDTLVDAVLEHGPTGDRLVFTFGSRPPEAIAQPVVGIVFAEPPFAMAGSGQPVTVAGERFLKVRMDGMVVARPNGDPVFKGQRDLRSAGGAIPEAVMVDESEGVVTWIVGLSSDGCPTVRRDITGGEKLVVELGG